MKSTMAPVRLAAGQAGHAGEVLGRAFHDEPGSVWLIPDEAERARLLPRMMEPIIRYCQLFGEAYTTNGGLLAAAGWLPPGQTELTLERMVQARMDRMPQDIGIERFARFMQMTGFLATLHRQAAPAEHYYLMVLGVDPPRQGQGIGGALIQPVLRRADAEKLPCYLETGKEINVRFYRRHGFEVVAEGDTPGGGPPYWTMLRPPAA